MRVRSIGRLLRCASYSLRQQRPTLPRSLHRHFSVTASPSDSPLYDICIIGGGLVGSTLALALQSAPLTRHLSIALIEPNAATTKAATLCPVSSSSAPPSLRTISLSPSSHSLLSSLSVWERYPPHRLSPFRSMLVWQQHPTGHIHWKGDELSGQGEQAVLGWSAENDLLLAAVYGCIEAGREEMKTARDALHAGVEVMSGVSVADIQLPSPPPAVSHSFSSSPSLFSSAVDIDDLIRPAQPVITSPPLSFPQLCLSNGRQIQSRLLIGSDGGNSAVQRTMAVPVVGWEYNQRAVVCNVQLALPPSNTGSAFDTAYQRFLPSGPIAVLPCHSNYASVIWSMDASEATRLCALSNEQFVERLNSALNDPPERDSAFEWYSTSIGRLVERVLPTQQLDPMLFPTPFTPSSVSSTTHIPPTISSTVTPRVSFPLRFLHTLTPAQPRSSRSLLIGDAAHVIHPLAGQGVNIGLRDVQLLVDRLQQAVRSGVDVGDDGFVVAEYERERRWAGVGGVGLMAGVDGLWRVFGAGRTDGAGMTAWLRGLGMRAFDSVSSIKYAAAKVSGVRTNDR